MSKGMTMTQKILAAHSDYDFVYPGQFIEADLDVVLANDITGPVAAREFARMGMEEVFDKAKIVLTPDHFTPNKDIKAAELAKELRGFAAEQGIVNYFEVGRVGIEHAFLPEQGLVTAGDVVIGADSHTCTYGALGAFSTGVGSTDAAAGMAVGRAWFRVPVAIRFELTGALPPWVSGKDVILHIIGKIGVDGALYNSMEFTGDGVAALSMDDRFAIANMAVEAGAKNGIFSVDGKTREYIAAHPAKTMAKTPRVFTADPDAEYAASYTINLSALRPTVSLPPLPDNTKTIDEAKGVKIDQSVIGSCTNGRHEDMEITARILKDRKVADGVRLIIIPGTQEIYLDCVENGWARIFVEAGAVFSTPTCGPCLGGHMGVLAEGERAIATTNRNFVGRMGHVRSEVYLASPAVAAASAVTGVITDPADI
ncbi:MAG: 3-isopropylmalate dehydratase large subunit [Clostridiales Family XIII bacterium]|jgi:3-isopropylmalate/(R)-2-methylmalate dehydratase large subunit|nr:3-isopropylmalate dehydratase large subunit [Clostridiales Family XIII bacterium]